MGAKPYLLPRGHYLVRSILLVLLKGLIQSSLKSIQTSLLAQHFSHPALRDSLALQYGNSLINSTDPVLTALLSQFHIPTLCLSAFASISNTTHFSQGWMKGQSQRDAMTSMDPNQLMTLRNLDVWVDVRIKCWINFSRNV